MKRLGVNIDHIATLRNARGEKHPDPLYAAAYSGSGCFSPRAFRRVAI